MEESAFGFPALNLSAQTSSLGTPGNPFSADIMAARSAQQLTSKPCRHSSLFDQQTSTTVSTNTPRPDPQRFYCIQPPRLPTFPGDDRADVESFATEAERIIRNCSLDRGAATEWVLQSLTGCARQEVLTANCSSPESILATLRATFGDNRGASSLRDAFHRRQQGETGNILEYAHHLQLLAQRANMKRPSSIEEETLRDHFVSGIFSPSLRRDLHLYIRDHPDIDFRQARAEAQRWLREDEFVPEVAVQQVTTNRDELSDTESIQSSICVEGQQQASSE